MSGECPLCARSAQPGSDPLFIHDFGSSALYLGDHQHFPGYCVLVWKAHMHEWHSLGEAALAQMWSDLAAASHAIEKAFHPWKLNHACLGNQVPHLHWHIFPRQESDPDRLSHPWLRQDQFAQSPTHPKEHHELVSKIRRHLA